MEIRIAICDDEHQQTEYPKMLVSKWADANHIKIHTEMFESAESFKSAWSKSKGFDILLLDIQMGGQNGVELAKDLRGMDNSGNTDNTNNTGNNLIIVFITALPDYITEGYDVFALHYLMKPINETKLCEVLDRAVKNIKKNITAVFLPVDGKQMRVSIGDIIYIESFAHFSEVNTVNGAYKVKMPISELEQQLTESCSDSAFARCHRSYIVGLKYVDMITKTDIVLDNGANIPLSRRLYNEVNKTLIKSFKGGR
jgi:DNA-binding LytR/AlgR family response regulator